MSKKVITVTLLIGSALVTGCSSSNDTPSTSKHGKNMEKNTAKTSVKKPSGLQYEIIESASQTAREAKNGDTVVVHYTGWLADSKTVFDSSHNRTKPFSFTLGAGMVIEGWQEGVLGMRIGEKRRLTIPSNLGYGKRGYPPIIPANATLIFDIELLEIL